MRKTQRLVGTVVDGKLTLVLVTERERDWRERASKPRAFVGGSAVEPAWEHPPFGSSRGDGSDEDKAWRKFNREELRLRKLVLKAVGVEGKFSRRAGCSCPCSPGFVTERGVRQGWDAWVVAETLKF